jgi:hypothetical protein
MLREGAEDLAYSATRGADRALQNTVIRPHVTGDREDCQEHTHRESKAETGVAL